MIKVSGIRAHDLMADSIDELVSKLKENGLSAIQFAPTKSFPEIVPSMEEFTKSQAEIFGEKFKKEDIEVSVLGCYVNLSSRDETIRKGAVNLFCQYIDLVKPLKAKFIGTETGSITNGYTEENFTEEAYQLMLDSLTQIVAYAEKKNVIISLEAGINHPLHDLSVIERVFTDIKSDNLVLLFDLVNLLTPDNALKQEELLENTRLKLGNKIQVVHLKNCLFDNGEKTASSISQGVVDYELLINWIAELPTKPILLFDEIPEKDLLDDMNYLSSLINRH